MRAIRDRLEKAEKTLGVTIRQGPTRRAYEIAKAREDARRELRHLKTLAKFGLRLDREGKAEEAHHRAVLAGYRAKKYERRDRAIEAAWLEAHYHELDDSAKWRLDELRRLLDGGTSLTRERLGRWGDTHPQ